ncbi:MAG TPA: ABC transporter permease [Anaerolineaceae bacterium]
MRASRVLNKVKQINYKEIGYGVGSAVASILIAIVIGGLLLLASDRNPLTAYESLLYGAFGTVGRFTETLVKATPLLIMAIAVSVSFRCQVWNIGTEGQFMLGAVFSSWVALTFSALPVVILVPFTFVAAIAGGAIWSGIAGVLKAHMNANEVITTSMLNYIAFYLVSFLVSGPMKDPQGFNFPQSSLIPKALELPRLISGTRLNIGILVALGLVIVALFFWRSTLGYRTKIVGASRRVARYAGLNVKRTIILVSLITGGVAGIAAWVEIFGIHLRLIENIASGMGSLAIVVALLGELHPLGMIVSAFLFAAFVVGGNAMERSAGVPFALVDVIQGVVILLVLSRSYFFRRKKA